MGTETATRHALGGLMQTWEIVTVTILATFVLLAFGLLLDNLIDAVKHWSSWH